MSNFAYTVAIKLSVANLASQGVKLLAKDLMAAHGAATSLQTKLSALKMIAVGYGMEKAGQGILGFMGKAIDASKDYTNQIALMNAAGFTHREVVQSIGSAWKTTNSVITSTAAGNLETLRELRSAFGAGEGMQHAYAMLPIVQRTSAMMQAMTGKEQKNVGFDMVKAIEFGTKGAINVPEMQKQSEMMTKALVAFGGTLSVGDFHQTLKAAKMASAYMTDDFKYTVLPTIMQEMKAGNGGAQAAGTAIATLFGTIKGHAIMKRQLGAWEDAGLILPGMMQHDPHHKGTDKIMPGGIAGENLFTQNPEAWAVKYLIPARDKLMAKYHMDEAGAYYSLTGNRNTAFMFSTLANKGTQFARDQGLINAVGSSYQSYQTLLKDSPELAQQAMHSQWQNLLAIIGYQILPKMIPFMMKFANGLNAISTWMAQHPNIAGSLILSLGALGIGLDIAGKALMAAGILKFLGILGTSATAATGAAGIGGVSGLAAILGGPLVAALAGAAAAAGVAYLAMKLLGSDTTKHNDGSDIASSQFGAGRGAHRAGRYWVVDGSSRTGNNGHWEGFLSGRFNSRWGPHGEPITSNYAVDPNIFKPNTSVGPPGDVYLDGHKVGHHVARHVVHHMHRHAQRPSTGSNGFNGSMSPVRPNM